MSATKYEEKITKEENVVIRNHTLSSFFIHCILPSSLFIFFEKLGLERLLANKITWAS
jgi:hypothetical protein